MFKAAYVTAASLLFVSCAAVVHSDEASASQPVPVPASTAAPVATAVPAAAAVPPAPARMTEIPGKATTERVCSQCHTLESVTNHRYTRDEWNGVIGRMIGQGLVAPEEDLYAISDYLTENYGPDDA